MFLLEALMDILKGTSKFMPNTPCCQVIVCLVMCQLCHTKRDPPSHIMNCMNVYNLGWIKDFWALNTIMYPYVLLCMKYVILKMTYLFTTRYSFVSLWITCVILKRDIFLYYKVPICLAVDHMCHIKRDIFLYYKYPFVWLWITCVILKGTYSLQGTHLFSYGSHVSY